MFRSRYMSCDACGGSIDANADELHVCEPERLVEFELFSLREGVARFERDLARWLATPHGRFAAWRARGGA